MTTYRVSVVEGINPTFYQKITLGFIDAPSRKKAIEKFLRVQPGYPAHRLVSEPKSSLRRESWEVERDMFPYFK